MRKGFVLKDGAGRPGGYLVQDMREICCRANGLTQQAKAVLIFSDGTQEEHALEDDSEARWPLGGRVLCGGFVCAQDRLLLATGEQARGAFARLILRKAERANKRAESERMQEEHAPQREEEAEKPQYQHIWPQRRWPPPPCWPQAVYTQGCWRERT